MGGARRVDPVLAGLIAALAFFPLLAAGFALLEPLERDAAVRLAPLARTGLDAELVSLPQTSDGERTLDEATLQDAARLRVRLVSEAERLLRDAGAARRLVRFAEQQESLRPEAERYGGNVMYPYAYPELDRFLARTLPRAFGPERSALANDVAVTFIHAAALPTVVRGAEDAFPQAGSVAFALLSRARVDGGCTPQRNLGLMLAGEIIPNDEAVAQELDRAAATCRGDPTPLWLLGQHQSVRSMGYVDMAADEAPVSHRDALAIFARLQRAFPRSAVGWSGAGDAELRAAYAVQDKRPFTARVHFRRAYALYRRARTLDTDPGLALGEARSLAGLRRFERAAQVQQRAGRHNPQFGPVQARLVEYLERAHKYREAVAVAERIADGAEFPVGTGFFPDATLSLAVQEDLERPLSLGADRFGPLRVNLGASPGGGGDAGQDIAFIPRYRADYGVTDHQRWCPGWAALRDMVLIGRSADARERLPTEAKDPRPASDHECASETSTLEAIAAAETGDRKRALELMTDADDEERDDEDEARSALQEARQNLWRFAGELRRARAVARSWRRALPTDALAYDRAGEIEFLAGHHSPAARLFARAATYARADAGFASVAEAEALLKRGAALERAGLREEAVETLREAEATASRAQGASNRVPGTFLGASSDAEHLSYHALAQLGYALLKAERYREAAEVYEEARDRSRTILYSTFGPESVSRFEVTFNNLALAQTLSGRPRDGVRSAMAAVRLDAQNPFSLATLGYALAKVGRLKAAQGRLEAAVRHFDNQPAAWNDLGVVAARRGDPSTAARAFRRAIGEEPDYALAWFNLGVLRERQAPWHAAAAQGALGRAIKADPSLATSKHVLTLDNAVHFSNLDLSKPLPPRWEFADVRTQGPAQAIGFAVVLLLGLQAGRAIAGQALGAGAAPFLDSARSVVDRLRGSEAFAPATFAVATTVAVFLYQLWRDGRPSIVHAALLVVGIGALIGTVWRARVLVARREEVRIEQMAWRPAVVLGLVAGLFGAPWAPLPVVRAERDAPLVHWIGPIVTVFLALVLLPLAVWLEVPVTRTLAGAALIMTASMLTPISPLDGGVVARGAAGGGATIALLGLGAFTLLGLDA